MVPAHLRMYVIVEEIINHSARSAKSWERAKYPKWHLLIMVNEVPSRIHFLPIGYEVERAVVPLKILRAEAVVLLTTGLTGKAGLFHRRVVEQIKSLGLPQYTIECNIWDPAVVVDTVGAIVTALPQHDYYFNVSTGSKMCAIGGQTAAMFYPIKLYYQAVDYDRFTNPDNNDHPAIGNPRLVSTFKVEPLDVGALTLLSFLATHSDGAAKHEIIDELQRKGIIGPKNGNCRISASALHAQVDVLRRHLEAWGFIEGNPGRGASLKLKLNSKGMAGHTMFLHRLKPRPPPEILSKL